MKRYLVFAHDAYYPSGALDDVLESFDDKECAIACAKTHGSYDHLFVWDRIEGETVWEKE